MRLDEVGKVIVGVGDDRLRLDRRDRNVGEEQHPGPDAAEPLPVARVAHVHERAAAREERGKLGEAKRDQHDDEAADDAAPDGEGTGDLRRVKGAEQPPRADHAGRAGEQKSDDTRVAPKVAGRRRVKRLRHVHDSSARANVQQR